MDLQIYYKKIRETVEAIAEIATVIVSLETPDGGREGVRTEAPRRIAAKMVVEGSARLATAEEALEFRKQNAEAKRRADQLAAASRMQFAVVSPGELRNVKGAVRPSAE
jgi:hypothetical protein